MAAALLILLSAAQKPVSRTEAQRRLDAAESLRQAQLAESARAAKTLAAAEASASRLATRRIEAAAGLRQLESEVIRAATRLQQAQQRSTEADAILRMDEASFAALIPIMLRLSRSPAETVLAVPLPPQQALEGLLVTRGIALELQHEAAALRAQQATAENLRSAADEQEAEYAARRHRQAAAAAALDREITTARTTIGEAGEAIRAAEEQAAARAAEANTLRDAIAAMDAAHKQAPRTSGALARHGPAGPMQRPAAGPILRAWGSPAEDGPATGMTIGTAPGAFVVSPCAGQVAFAAPFRSYGKLVIVECGGGVDIVLAGLDRIDASVGRSLRAGEPIGRMAETGAGAASRPSLYLELRRAGEAQDPAPFLNARG